MKRKFWYKLDNVGKFYSFTNKDKIPAVFRYSVTLTEAVDPIVLEQALSDTLGYFPSFNCHLKRGLFWYYLETSDKKAPVSKEDRVICAKIYKNGDDFLFRVNYYKKRINFEVSHILSDGRGSLSFFKCLVYKYLILKYNLLNVDIDSDSSAYEKTEDSFDKYYTKPKFGIPKNMKKIYQYKGKKKKDITFIEYHISANKTLELAHKHNASLTALLVAVLICSYQKQMKEVEYNQTIKIDIPVDLRQFFKSSTSRNFFGLTFVEYKFNSKDYSFSDVIDSVNNQLKENVTLEQLKVRMNQMIFFEKNLLARIMPIFIKDYALSIINVAFASSSTSCISNIGLIKVDKELEKYIENFNVLTTTGTLKLTICSFKDDLSIGFSTKYINNNIIKDFCRFFSENDIFGKININEEYSDDEM